MAKISNDVLARVELFSDLDKKELEQIGSMMREHSYEAGREVVTEGKEGLGFFIIAEGRATVTIEGGEVRTLGPGDYFGEIALMRKSKRTATVTAAEPLTCWSLTAWDFRPLVEANGSIGWKLLQAVAGRVD